MRLGIVAIFSLILGAATTLSVAWLALIDADRSSGSSSSMLIRGGTELWFVRRLTGFGLEWINCEAMSQPLSNPAPDLIDIPPWAIPPDGLASAGTEVRFATLAVGWPAPFVIRQWSAARQLETFPLRVELDDGHDSLRRASERFRASETPRGVIGKSGHANPRIILWRGAVINVALFGVAWLVALMGAAMLLRALHGKKRNQESDEQKQANAQSGHSQQHLG